MRFRPILEWHWTFWVALALLVLIPFSISVDLEQMLKVYGMEHLAGRLKPAEGPEQIGYYGGFVLMMLGSIWLLIYGLKRSRVSDDARATGS